MIRLLIFLLVVATKCFNFPNKLWIYNDKPIENSSLLIQLQNQRIEYLQNNWNRNHVTLDNAKEYLD